RWLPDLREHARELDALLLATRERRVASAAQTRGAGHCQRLHGDAPIAQPWRAGHVGGAAKEDDLVDAKRERQDRALRQDRADPGELAAIPALEGATADAKLAGADGEVAGEGAKERGLASAVGADDGDELSGLDAHIDPANDVATAGRDEEIARLDHAMSPFFCPRRRSQRKKGAPSAAVRTPMGSSAGATTVRLTTSAETMTIAPSSAAAGSRRRCRGPT